MKVDLGNLLIKDVILDHNLWDVLSDQWGR
jgi:hypothetical protein